MQKRWHLPAAALFAGCSVVFLLVAVYTVGGNGARTGQPSSLARLYHYDKQAPFHLIGHVIPNKKVPVVLRSVQFSDGRGGEVFAFVCVPRGMKGPFPGVVMVPGSFGREADFLVECIEFAARGAVAMSMVTPFIQGSQSGPSSAIPSARFYLRHFEDNVVGIRRAIDLLQSRYDVKRIALAGYSLGASLSSVVAGVDPRVHVVGLVAPPSHSHFVPPLQGRTKAEADRILAPVDPKRYLRQTKAHLFLEMARYDQIEIRPEQRAVIRAAGANARVKWYPTDHRMDVQAWTDLVDWLGRELGLGPLPSSASVPA